MTNIELIRATIVDQGRRVGWVAGRVGISSCYLSNILAGRRRMSEVHARRIAEVLSLPAGQVLQTPAEPSEVTA